MCHRTSGPIIRRLPAARQGPHGLSGRAVRPTLDVRVDRSEQCEPVGSPPSPRSSSLAALVLAAPAGADTSPLAKRLAAALAVPHVSRARTAALAFDLQTGTTVFSQHDALSLAPGLEREARGHLRRARRARAGVPDRDRRRRRAASRTATSGAASLLLVGHGDPTLSTHGLPALAAQVRAAGIVRVTGARLRRRVVLRRAADGARLEVVVLRQRVAAALGADRRPRRLPRADVRATRRSSAALCVPRRAAPRRRHGRRAAPASASTAATGCRWRRSSPRRSRRSSARWTARATTSPPSCCSSSSGRSSPSPGTTAAGAAFVASTLADAGVPLAGVRIVDGSGLSLLDR